MKEHKYSRFIITYNIVLLIPLLIISVIVIQLFQQHEQRKVDAEIQINMERQTDYWTQQTKVIHTISQLCKYDKKYNEDYCNGTVSYIEIFEDFKEKLRTFPFVDNIYLYDPLRQAVLSSSGKSSADYFFTSDCVIDPSVFDGSLQDSKIYAFPAYTKKNASPGVVFVAPINTYGPDGRELKYLLYTVTSVKMNSQFGQTVEDGFTVVRSGEQVLYTAYPFNSEESWESQYQALLTSGNYHSYSSTLEDDFSVTIFVPKKNLISGANIYLQGYGYWFLCSLLIGSLFALYFSQKHHLAFKTLLYQKTTLTTERDALKKDRCLYELLAKTIDDSDPLYDRCLESHIRIDLTYKFYVIAPEDISGTLADTDLDFYKIELMPDLYIYLICSDKKPETLDRIRDQFAQRQLGLGSIVTDVSALQSSYQDALHQLKLRHLRD